MSTDILPRRSTQFIRRPSHLPSERGLDERVNPGLAVAGAGLVGFGLYKRGIAGLFYAGVGAGLFMQWLATNELLDQGRARKLLNTKTTRTAEVSASLTIERPVDMVYERWRALERFPTFMRHIESVDRIGPDLYHWRARVPKTHEAIEWEARVIEDVPGERIAWRSLEGSDIHNQGIVEFRRGPHSGQTEVTAIIDFRPPAGNVGAKIVKFLHAIPEQYVKENLRNFKQVVEAGELPTTEGQTSGRASLT